MKFRLVSSLGATAIAMASASGPSNSLRRGKGHAMRVVAVATLGLCPILVGCWQAFAQVGMPAPAAPGPNQLIGLPRVRDYEPIPQLRDIHFDFGTAVIRPGDARTLDANAAWLRDHPDYLVLIEGHCDSRGAASRKNEFNMDLGEQRAEAAMNHLIAQGIHPSRITTLSYGEERPQCTEQTERCWSQNRRSRFLVKPH